MLQCVACKTVLYSLAF